MNNITEIHTGATTKKTVSLSIGILTWNKPAILEQTLASYKASGLLDFALESMLFLQENNPAESALANKYGLTPIYSPVNVGIQEAYRRLCANAQGEYFLFLENDWECIEDEVTTALRLRNAIEILRTGMAHCVRLRHKYFFGEPLYGLQFQGKEPDAPKGWLNCIHWIEDPTIKFPEIFQKICLDEGGEDMFLASSCHANFTNNPCMYKTEFIKKIAENNYRPTLTREEQKSQNNYAISRNVPPDLISLQGNIASWWAEQHFIVAAGTGLFAHRQRPRSLPWRARVKQSIKRICFLEKIGATSRKGKNPIQHIAFICAHRDSDIWSTPLSLIREFAKRGWKTRIFSLFDEADRYHDRNVAKLYHMILEEQYFPDIIFHLDYTGFRSKFFAKLNMPDIYTVFESSDDPQRFANNNPKAKDFKLILTPDYSCQEKYESMGSEAIWWPHFCDDIIHKLYPEVRRGDITVSTRGQGSSTIMDELSVTMPDIFINKMGLHGEAYGKFFASASIVLQHSRHKEITRRIFEGMACGCMVLTDRLPEKTMIQRIFSDNEDIVFYDDVADCSEKIRYYLSENGKVERNRIAENGYKKVHTFHTQKKRVDAILEKYNAWLASDA